LPAVAAQVAIRVALGCRTERPVDALSKYGGRVLKSSLSTDAEGQLQEALAGAQAPVGAAHW
jgi:uncharacterized membrane protein